MPAMARLPYTHVWHKRPTEDASSPWLMTYGDLMSLLLCLFVMVATFSEVRRDSSYGTVLSSLQRAFGSARAPRDKKQAGGTLVAQLAAMTAADGEASKGAVSADAGVCVRHDAEGLHVVLEGDEVVMRDASGLTPAGQEVLRKLAEQLAASRVVVSLRGRLRFDASDKSAADSAATAGLALVKSAAAFLAQCGIRSDRWQVEAVPVGVPERASGEAKATAGEKTGAALEVVVRVVSATATP